MSCRALIMAAAAVCGVAFGGAGVPVAQAADQSVMAPRPAPPPVAYPNSYYPTSIDWTGFYAGLQAGGSFTSATWADPFSGQNVSVSGGTVTGGGTIGFNFQRDIFVIGLQTEFDGMDAHASSSAGPDTDSLKANWLWTVTGRFGFAYERALFYAKVGLAVGDERDRIVGPSTPGGSIAATGTTTQYGWVAGGGIEYALDYHWSARLDYQYIDFNQGVTFAGNYVGGNGAWVSYTGFSASPTYTIQRVVVGVNYRF
jgi:outer membrane immunogenic protein